MELRVLQKANGPLEDNTGSQDLDRDLDRDQVNIRDHLEEDHLEDLEDVTEGDICAGVYAEK